MISVLILVVKTLVNRSEKLPHLLNSEMSSEFSWNESVNVYEELFFLCIDATLWQAFHIALRLR